MRELLKPESFYSDEPVGFAVVDQALLPGPLPDDQWSYIPERLWHRLLKLGEAYDLHFAAIVEPVIDTILVPAQCEAMAAEFEFLLNVVNDPALEPALSPLLSAARAVASQSQLRLVLSPQ